jgi:hypothetical protein
MVCVDVPNQVLTALPALALCRTIDASLLGREPDSICGCGVLSQAISVITLTAQSTLFVMCIPKSGLSEQPLHVILVSVRVRQRARTCGRSGRALICWQCRLDQHRIHRTRTTCRCSWMLSSRSLQVQELSRRSACCIEAQLGGPLSCTAARGGKALEWICQLLISGALLQVWLELQDILHAVDAMTTKTPAEAASA